MLSFPFHRGFATEGMGRIKKQPGVCRKAIPESPASKPAAD